jgi:hypothetical protein
VKAVATERVQPAAAAVVSGFHENADRFETPLSRLDWASVPFVVSRGDTCVINW